MVSEARKWERDYWVAHTEVSDLKADILPTIPAAPASHGVSPVDIEKVMADSDDPVWDIVIDCRQAGIVDGWLEVVRPDLTSAPPHRVYGEFASYILNLPESDRNVDGVMSAILFHHA